MISVELALQQILEKMRPLPARKLPLLEALGCVLAEDITASEPLPPFTNSAMDGYAVRAADGTAQEAQLRIIDELPAGEVSRWRVERGTAIKIMTGAPVPDGADAVVPIEDVEVLPDGAIRLHAPVSEGQHIRLQGEEVQPGERLLAKGRVLKPEDLGLLASLGCLEVFVIPRPQVSILTTGSEVVDPSAKPKPGQIRNSNLTAIVASVETCGARVAQAEHVADEPERLKCLLSSGRGDVLITCGGVSVGDYDFVKTVLFDLGEIYFWKVAIKPGKPFVFGRIGKKWVFGLPGNPVSALVAFEVLVKPALRALSGQSPEPLPLQTAFLSAPVHHKPGRREFVRAYAHQNGKGLVVEPIAWQGSGMLRSLTEANAWVVVPDESEGLEAGSLVEVLLK